MTEEDEACDNRRVPQRNLSSHQFSRAFVQRYLTSPFSSSGGDEFWGGSWEIGSTEGLGYLCCGLVCPRGCTPLPMSAAPVGISHTAIPVSTIGLGFSLPYWPMLTVDNFVSELVSFILHLGALPGSWTVTTLLALSWPLSLQGSGCRQCSLFFTWASRPSHHTLTYGRKVYFISTDDVHGKKKSD